MNVARDRPTATGARPMPESGMREPSPRDLQRRNEALRCLREQNSTQCQGRVHINVFFDGTGNNWDWAGTFVSGKSRSSQTQRARNGHTNIVRLWDAAVEEATTGIFKIYVPGVGTPFEEVGDTSQDGDMAGGAAARYGAHRINWAILQVYNSLSRYVENGLLFDKPAALAAVQNMTRVMSMSAFDDWIKSPSLPLSENAHRQLRLREKEDHLAAVLKALELRKKVLEVNVSVFGFSRGSAQARTFAHWLFEIARYNNYHCSRMLAGVPLKLNFMGIFDTVASVGIASCIPAVGRLARGKMNWAWGEMMSIHPDVEQCVHFAALHEQRMNFPLDFAPNDGGRRKQVLYPGMHSDVGGGYTPGSQGKGMRGWGASPNLSQIPLIDMYHEAFTAGVFLKEPSEIKNDATAGPGFACDIRLIRCYNNWLSKHGVAGGDHRRQIRGHAQQYLRWRGLRAKDGPSNMRRQRYFIESDHEDQYDLNQAQVWMSVSKAGNEFNFIDRLNSERDLLNAFDAADVAPEVAALLDDYVHDSLAGFYILKLTELMLPNTDGYFRYRETFTVGTPLQPSVCVHPSSLPPTNVPSIDQIIGDMGRAFGN